MRTICRFAFATACLLMTLVLTGCFTLAAEDYARANLVIHGVYNVGGDAPGGPAVVATYRHGDGKPNYYVVVPPANVGDGPRTAALVTRATVQRGIRRFDAPGDRLAWLRDAPSDHGGAERVVVNRETYWRTHATRVAPDAGGGVRVLGVGGEVTVPLWPEFPRGERLRRRGLALASLPITVPLDVALSPVYAGLFVWFLVAGGPT